jgi:hypothetical protein
VDAIRGAGSGLPILPNELPPMLALVRNGALEYRVCYPDDVSMEPV